MTGFLYILMFAALSNDNKLGAGSEGPFPDVAACEVAQKAKREALMDRYKSLTTVCAKVDVPAGIEKLEAPQRSTKRSGDI